MATESACALPFSFTVSSGTFPRGALLLLHYNGLQNPYWSGSLSFAAGFATFEGDNVTLTTLRHPKGWDTSCWSRCMVYVSRVFVQSTVVPKFLSLAHSPFFCDFWGDGSQNRTYKLHLFFRVLPSWGNIIKQAEQDISILILSNLLGFQCMKFIPVTYWHMGDLKGTERNAKSNTHLISFFARMIEGVRTMSAQ